jgi:hypothetical protein
MKLDFLESERLDELHCKKVLKYNLSYNLFFFSCDSSGFNDFLKRRAAK